MHRSSPLARVVATLGVLVVIQSAAILRYHHDLKQVTPILPTRTVEILGATVGLDRLLIFAIGGVLTVALWAGYRFTSFGRITAAVAEGEYRAASMGHSPQAIALLNWTVGAAIGAFAGVLIGPITFLEPNQLVQLIVPALAAALLGGFRSFPLAFGAAALIGVIESVMTLLVTRQGWFAGWSQAVAFASGRAGPRRARQRHPVAQPPVRPPPCGRLGAHPRAAHHRVVRRRVRGHDRPVEGVVDRIHGHGRLRVGVLVRGRRHRLRRVSCRSPSSSSEPRGRSSALG